MEKKRCSEIVFGANAFHQHACSNTGKIERDGKFYCGIHDPIAVTARMNARNKKWDREWAEEDAARERNKTLSPETARELIEAFEISIQYMPTDDEPGYVKEAYREARECRKTLSKAKGELGE